MIWGWCPCPT